MQKGLKIVWLESVRFSCFPWSTSGGGLSRDGVWAPQSACLAQGDSEFVSAASLFSWVGIRWGFHYSPGLTCVPSLP